VGLSADRDTTVLPLLAGERRDGQTIPRLLYTTAMIAEEAGAGASEN